MAHSSGSAHGAAAKAPAAGKKKEPKAELSEEDATKKAEIDLLVERCQDVDQIIQTQALTQLRTELASSTSSMTSVPRALKFLRPHYEVLKALFASMTASSNKTLLADMLSVLAMSMAANDSRESLSFKLKGNWNDLESWGHGFVRSLGGELGQEWMARSEAQPPETTDDLLELVHVIVPFHIRQHSEHEAIDLLLEVDHLGEILNFVDAASAPRISRYLLSCADFLPEGEEAEVLKVAERVCRKAEMWPDALRAAARTGDPDAVQQVFNDAPDGVVKKQLALMAGSLQLNIITDDEELQALCGNSRLSSWYLQLAKDLNVSEAKHPDEIVKSGESRLAGEMQDAKKNLSTSLISALTNAGHCNDKVLCATVAEGAEGAEPGSGAKWFYRHKDDSQFSAVAALGLVHLWNIEEGPNAIDVLSYATETEISAGSLLATGIICCNCRSDTDPALAILRDHLDLTNSETPPLKRIAAAMGLGLSYCGTAREDVSEILSAIVADSEVGTDLFSLAALSLGAVFVGTGNNSVAETICNALICERSDLQLRSTMTRFACLGLGLVFLGRQDCCEAILEACKAMPEVCRDYASMTVRTCAYAGTGNVVHIQELMHICAEHRDATADKKDAATAAAAPAAGAAAVGGAAAAAPAPAADIYSAGAAGAAPAAASATAAADDCHLGGSAEQAVAAIGLVAAVLGEEVGGEMARRLLDGMLQFGDPSLRRIVPMAMAMLNVSNPKPEVLESLSRLAHDRDEVTAFQAILGIGLVAAGTNNSRGAQSLRQQAEFFAKDSESLFLVRLAQGLLHCGRGLMTLAPQRSDHLILSKPALTGLLIIAHASIDLKNTLLGKHHYLLFWLAVAMQPRMCMLLDHNLDPIKTQVRVGTAVDTVGQVGKPKAITGFQTHSSPVLLHFEQRAELASEEFLPVTPVMEGTVILTPNPDYKPPRVEEEKKK